MNDWELLLYCIGSGLMIWLIIRTIRHHPRFFSREALSKSFFTLGILALILIALIFLCVLVLKAPN